MRLSKYLSFLFRILIFLSIAAILFMQYKLANSAKVIRKFYKNHYTNVYNDSAYQDLSLELKLDFEQLSDEIKSNEMMAEDFFFFTLFLSSVLLVVTIGEVIIKWYLRRKETTI